MANGKIRFGKQSGGQLALVIPNGVANTEVIVPESGILATQAYADGKTTLAQVKNEICTGNNLVTSSTGAVGYRTGAGGTVTQDTSKNTAVILNKPTGQITMNSAALAAGASVSFTLTNSLIANTDILVLSLKNGSGSVNAYKFFSECANGNGVIQVTNISAINLAEAIVINFAIIKGAIL